MTVKLEKGFYGSNVQQYGAYNYRGFDICVSSTDGGTPVEGQPFTVGLYEADKECQGALHLEDLPEFSVWRAQICVEQIVDEYVYNDETMRQMRKLLSQTHNASSRALIEEAISNRQSYLNKEEPKAPHPMMGDLRATWDRLTYDEKLKIRYGYIDEAELNKEFNEALEDTPIGDMPEIIKYYEDIIANRK